jgi:hypothetical protein
MSDLALLAPVPLEHLEDARDVCESTGLVAFGSRAWEVFRELDERRDGQPITVYIYASNDPSPAYPEISWVGRYVHHIEGIGGAHPNGMKHRPKATAKYPTDNKGHWAVFWELDKIQKLDPDHRIQMSSFLGYKSGKVYKKHFIPEGPVLVTYNKI